MGRLWKKMLLCYEGQAASATSRPLIETGHFALGFSELDAVFEVLALVAVGLAFANADRDVNFAVFSGQIARQNEKSPRRIRRGLF